MKQSTRIVVFAFLLIVVALQPMAAAVASPGISVQALGTGEPALTPTDLAQDLAGSGVTVSNVSYTGASPASGRFTGGGTPIGLESGVLLTSGNVDNVVGPNESDGAGQANGEPGDADLNALLPSGSSQDASVLEFDFVPDQSPIFFRYVFGSDEYNEFVYSGFNDVFGFFVGDEDKVNCAVVPGTETPVSIDTINGGNPFGSNNASHPELYRNNDLEDGGSLIDTELDGLTTILTCTADVVPDAINHVKLAIADVGDSNLDSAVFLESNSFSTTPPGVADLSIDKTDEPDPVTAGGALLYTLAVANAGPDDATNVVVADTLPSGTTFMSAEGDGWECGEIEGTVTCTRPGLAAGSSEVPSTAPNIEIVVQTSSAGVITNIADVSADEGDPVPANNHAEATTTVQSQSTPDTAATFCADGCTLDTDPGTGATRTDPTVTFLIVPDDADSQTVSILEFATTPTYCGGSPCSGQLVKISEITGVGTPSEPIVAKIVFDKSVKGGTQIYIQKPPFTSPPRLVANCSTPGVASPHPCVSSKIVLPNGDREITVLLLSGDPIMGKK